jgi:signal transduction histidine kinase
MDGAVRRAGPLKFCDKHIFQRFWHGKDTTRTGAGLGLAIVDEIMKAHDGRVLIGDGPREARFLR